MFSPTPRLLWLTFWLMVPAITAAGIETRSVPFVALFAVVLAAMLVVDAYRVDKTLAQVTVSAKTPVTAYKDRAGNIEVNVQLPMNLSEVKIALGLPTSFQVDEPVGTATATTAVNVGFTPRDRGEFLVQQVFLSGQSGWGMWRMRIEKSMDLRIRVFPDLSRDPASKKLFAVFQQGQRVQRVIGRGRDVERLREYAAGDSFEEVYWKATARRGAPISKVFQIERTQDIYAIVDGSRLGNRNQALERFVTASLLLGIATERNSDNFGLLTFSDRVQHFVRASRGKGHYHRCREAIFDLQPSSVSPDFNELITFINLRIRKRALLFFLTDLSDPLLAETFVRDASLVARRHVVVVNQIADSGDRPLFSGSLPQNEMEVQTRLAGHLQWAKLRELERALSHLGIRMLLLKPERASGELIAQYTMVKQRQLL